MAVKAASSGRTRRSSKPAPPPSKLKLLAVRYLPVWIALAIASTILLPRTLTLTLNVTGRVLSVVPNWIEGLFAAPLPVADFFTPEVKYWAGDIARWSREYNLDPNLLATVMQIESCGHPTVSSSAGAQGLFQVMPFHFDAGEDQLDPDTNAKRAADFLKICISGANNNAGLTLACYNGGQSVITQPFAYWQDQTQRYYRWGLGIYTDAVNHQSHSDTLDQWLAAGGSALCRRAEAALGIRT